MCLVRTEEKGEQVKKVFPNARIVLGDLDDSALLEEEAAKADIVLRTPFSIEYSLKEERSLYVGL